MTTAFVVLSIFLLSAQSDPKAEGIEAKRQKDYVKAYRLLLPLAQAGDHQAQQIIADFYFAGDGVKRDVRKAVEWYEKAAAGGNINGRRNLGAIYMTESEVQDWAKAEYWYGQLANEGDVESMAAMSVLCLISRDDREQSMKWSLKAAEAGHEDAMLNVAKGYVQGKVFPKDFEQARHWFKRLADKGFPAGHNGLGDLYSKGDLGAPDVAKALFHYNRAAEAGLAVAQSNLGRLYYDGKLVERDYPLAVRWFTKAASQGDPGGTLYLGYAYGNGHGMHRDLVRAHVALRLFCKVVPVSDVNDTIAVIERQLSAAERTQAERLYSGIVDGSLSIAEILPFADRPIETKQEN